MGVDRLNRLVASKYFDGSKFFRVVRDFLVQFGIHGDPDVNSEWNDNPIADETTEDKCQPASVGTLAFAGNGKDSRAAQMMVWLGDQECDDNRWGTPVGKATKQTVQILQSLYEGYGDTPPWGEGPDQDRLAEDGDAYAEENFPLLDHIKSCKIEPATPALQRHNEL
eukprot:m.235977 g.235977  ORF g.235977 m.235977 type:complete len:167 (+) comp18934_c1_seq2:166-666(+)